MKKIICIITMFVVLANSILCISNTAKASTDALAKDIAANTKNLKPEVAKLAIDAFYCARQSGIAVKKPVLTIIDYTLPSTQKRLWVVDLESKQVLHHSLVAHGKHSGENYATRFSNIAKSRQSSVGLFLTEGTYFGGNGYSLYLQGLEKGFNDKAKSRTIVLHGAPYVNKQFAAAVGRLGRSGGCPAVEKQLATPIINTIKDGTLLLAFYPQPEWLSKSRFINNQA